MTKPLGARQIEPNRRIKTPAITADVAQALGEFRVALRKQVEIERRFMRGLATMAAHKEAVSDAAYALECLSQTLLGDD
ncbi:MAG TPA: hypothetical protein VIJ33_07730 [Solirubrobacteraceae bacterium]